MDTYDNPILFGRDPLARIVAVEPGIFETMLLYVRQPDGGITVQTRDFTAFAWQAEGTEDDQPLNGPGPLRFIRRFKAWKHFQNSRAAARGTGVASFALSDPVQQFLTQTGLTLFKELVFEDLHRLQIGLDAETIHLGDTTGWTLDIDRTAGGATAQLNAAVADRDPDVIEGHNLFKEILPALVADVKKSKTTLPWGRDESVLTSRNSRLQIAEKTIQYPRFACHGRHLVDTWVLAQYYDIGTRELEDFDLPTVAAHLKLADATLAPTDPRVTAAVAAALSPSYFIQAQIFPYNYQDVIVRGNATKIDALFLREYFHRGHSLPEPPESRFFEGGMTDVFFHGVARDVWHCDVASLYPSVILTFDYLPKTDHLAVFSGLLRDLRTFRLAAKGQMRDATDETSRRHFSALQNTFKILINSFYGYLGFGQGHFADFDAAAAVTAKGRELLRQMVDWLNEQGSHIIEIDTDGIYFQPPHGVTVETLDAGLRAELPDGIEVDFDHRYDAMFSYKAKNYALLEADGTLILKGAALKSRGMEPYLRDFLQRLVRHILAEDAAAAHQLRADYERDLRARSWPVERIAKTEALQDSPAAYEKKIAASSRNRSAAFELALASDRNYQAGDTVSYYITGGKKKVTAYDHARLVTSWNGDARDENVEYYVGKLNDLHKKFADFIPEPTDELF